MLFGIAIILLCQLTGEALSHALSLPIPGPVLGMVFMMLFLWLKENMNPFSSGPAFYSTENTGKYILANMSILFVPASVGIIDKFDILSQYSGTLAVALVASTLLALLASAYTFILVARLTNSIEDHSHE